MNREELDAMTDEELKIKAAELDGWEDVRAAPEICGHIVGRHPKMEAAKGAGFDLIPNYTNDIAAAWGLMEHNPDWRWAVYELDGDGWCATPMEIIGTRKECCLWSHVVNVAAETAPRAITKAFILAMNA